MFQDTIAAICTPPGRAGLAVVRVSGPACPEIAEALGFGPLRPRHAELRTLRHPGSGSHVDRVIVTRFVAPASYTGEDVLEISCHGGALLPAQVLDAVLAAGARLAEGGEFTRRAFWNGKLDLVQVEATLDLVDARSEALARAALFQLEGGLSRRIEHLREELVRLRAMLAYEIDFPEEDDGPVPAGEVEAAAAGLREELQRLLRHAPEGELLREGALTVIAGAPNVGKSSLFNALLGYNRAIVTELPGTTRDAIEAMISLDGYPFRLVDTAGLREESEYVEGLGIEVARGYLKRADLILFCAEAGRNLSGTEREIVDGWRGEGRSVIPVRTKADRSPPKWKARPEEVAVSAVTGEGLDGLRRSLLDAVFAGLVSSSEAPLLLRRRQVRAVEAALAHLEAFAADRISGQPPEIAATHLEEASLDLELLLGAVDVEDVLEAVFQEFCVGK